MKIWTILLGLSLLATLAAGLSTGDATDADDDGTLFGTVTDADTGDPLPGAAVTLSALNLGAATGADGQYTILNVPPGRHEVQVAFIGYRTITRKVRIRSGKQTTLNVKLKPGVELDEVVVSREFRDGNRKQAAPQAAPIMAQQYARNVAPARSDRPPAFNTEDYDYIAENTFQNAKDHPLSTFSIDVDAASYSNLRRFIRDGQTPPPDAVRIEEMVNYFVYDYPDPDGDRPFSITTEVGTAPWNPAHRLVHIGLQGKRIAADDRPASNLVFLLDVSGSMSSPDKLPLLKQAFRLLVDELTERDRVAITVYAGAAGLVLPSTPGDQKDTILDALGRLEAGGSTAGAAGIRLAYETARQHFIEDGNNRVILATDGDFNVGTSSDGELVRLIEEKRRQGTFLTVLGFGTGNLKDSKMEKIADHGNGNYYYIDGPLEAKKVLVSELGSTLFTIAKDVKIQVEFNPAHVAAYRLIGYENRLLADEDFDDDTKDAGELGAGHTVTALYEVIPVGAETDTAVRNRGDLKYQDTAPTAAARASGELMNVKLRYKAPDGDTSRLIERPLRIPAPGVEASGDNFYFSAAVAAFGMILRDSEHKGNASTDMVLALAKDAQGADREGYRAEFIRLVEDYRKIVDEAAEPTATLR